MNQIHMLPDDRHWGCQACKDISRCMHQDEAARSSLRSDPFDYSLFVELRVLAASMSSTLSGSTDALMRSSVMRNCSGSQLASSSDALASASPALTRIMTASASPHRHACTMPSPENPAATHSAPPVPLPPEDASRARSRPDNLSGTFPTHGNPSVVNPMMPVHMASTASSPPPAGSPQLSRANAALRTPPRCTSAPMRKPSSCATPSSSSPRPCVDASPPPSIISPFEPPPPPLMLLLVLLMLGWSKGSCVR
ncbi:hypothetical protein VTK73DRAFT_3679 [Phialemonium thermophilum]|uniref:Uncharacterized protein n=1 Tax=Phialemonium thermophilum TaxID=223376 RepID=A0ABR3VHH2_9PEZI